MFNIVPFAGVHFYSAYLGGNSSGPTASSFTFSGLSFGPEYEGRRIVAAVSCGGIDREPSSVTIGGVSATKIAGVLGPRTASLWEASPLGTSGNVVVSIPSLGGGCGVLLWAIWPFSLLSGTQTTPGGSLTIGDPGVAFGAGMDSAGSSPTITWTNLTADASVTWTNSGANYRLSGARLATPGTVTVNISGSSGGPYGFATAAYGI